MTETLEKLEEKIEEPLKMVKIDRDGLLNIIHKALCINKKEKLLDSIVLRMEESGISFMKIEGDSVAAFGRFDAEMFKTYEIVNPPFDIEINLRTEFIEKIKDDLQGEVITIEQTQSDRLKLSTILSTPKRKRTRTVSYYSIGKFDKKFQDNLKLIKIDKNTFPILGISQKADQFEEDDPKHSPILAHIIINIEELQNNFYGDFVILRGNDKDITVETIQYGRANTYSKGKLTTKLYKLLVDNFRLKVDKPFWDLIVSQFSGTVNITIAKKYLMFLENKKGVMFGYMVGVMGDSFISEVFIFDRAQDDKRYIPLTNKTELGELIKKRHDGLLHKCYFRIDSHVETRIFKHPSEFDSILEKLRQQIDAVQLLKDERANIHAYDGNTFIVANTDLFQKALDQPAILLEIEYPRYEQEDELVEEMEELDDLEE